MGEAASTDKPVAKDYPTIKKVAEGGDYIRNQNFDFGETGVYIKHVPSRTYIS